MFTTIGSALRKVLQGLDLALDQAHPPRWLGHTPDGRRVMVELGGPLTEAAVVSVEHGHDALFVVPRGIAPSSAGELRTGDVTFDARVLVVGGDEVAGLLGHDVRTLLEELVVYGFVVSAGYVRVVVDLRVGATPDVEERIARALALAAALARIRDVPRAALRIAAFDPDPKVCRRYQELAQAPELRAIATADELAELAPDDHGLAVATTHLADDTLELGTRAMVAAWAIDRFAPGRLAETPATGWSGLAAVPEACAALIASVKRSRDMTDAHGAMRLLEWCVDGELSQLPPELARAALVTFDPLFGTEDRAWLTRLIGHGDGEIASRASAELLETYSLDELARLTQPSAKRRSRRSTDLLIDRLSAELERPDIDPPTRARCLEILGRVVGDVDGAPELPWARATSAARLTRFVAALQRGREPTLLALLAPLADCDDDAVRHLAHGAMLGLPVSLAALRDALSPAAMADLITVAPRIVDSYRHNAAARLLELYPGRDGPSATKVGYIQALARTGDLAATSLLVTALDDARDVRLAALEGLVRIGGPGALPQMRTLRTVGDPVVRTLATRAFEAIVARHGDGAGQLTMSDSETTGGLTLPGS